MAEPSSSMIAPERDIELVLVTGAGASRDFGVQGQKLPLMADWCNHLIKSLQPGWSHLELTGLRQDMTGMEFERQLGGFLGQVEAFRAIGGLAELTGKLPNLPNGFDVQGSLKSWHVQVTDALDQILEAIHKSLYEQFSEVAFDTSLVDQVYKSFFDDLRLTPEMPFVFATTNYDLIATRMLADLGFKPDWGPPPMVSPGGEAELVVDDLLSGMPRYTPVLHLHGKAGWYVRGDGRFIETAAMGFSSQFGTPIVMLPDPNKDYGANSVINMIWDQFRLALGRAKQVLVLGHSLHDPYLVQALRELVSPMKRLAVTSYRAGNESPDMSEDSVEAIVQRDLPGAVVIPALFGPSSSGWDQIQKWRDGEPAPPGQR